ncbi:hypothetical protein [Pseudomonas sp. TSRC2-2]|uniref:hypothetical protein n=1 Tax=Pseudomonas sp. TSRC2-2 TaxID=2804571 RepID=UPI003CEA1633
MQSITEKEKSLWDTVAMPQASDWQLLSDNPSVLIELNTVLINALHFAKSGTDVTFGEVAEQIFPALAVIDKKYPDSGVTDSEGYLTVARFFAINYSPAIYDFLRYYGAEP